MNAYESGGRGRAAVPITARPVTLPERGLEIVHGSGRISIQVQNAQFKCCRLVLRRRLLPAPRFPDFLPLAVLFSSR